MNIVQSVEVYGLEQSIKASKYPMSTDINKLDTNITNTQLSLAKSLKGSGHDQFLTGIVVQFDLTFTVKAWTEAERYHFFDFVSSQSTMHRITQFDLDNQYSEYTDPRIVAIIKEKIDKYNENKKIIESNRNSNKNCKEYIDTIEKKMVAIELENEASLLETQNKRLYLEILYSNPCGFKLTARMTTNYRQLKTIYSQRKNHRLPEWRSFCEWIETLPHSEMITG